MDLCVGLFYGRISLFKLFLLLLFQATHFDIYNLEFKCRYRISVREVTSEGFKSFHEASVTFNTPSCEDILSTTHKGPKPICSIFNKK